MRRWMLTIGWCWLMFGMAQAQYLSFQPAGYLGFAHSQGGEYFYGGFGLGIQYEHELGPGRVLGTLEYRAVQWGNQVAFNAGYDYPYWTQGPWRAGVRGQLQMGSALFQSGGLLVWGAEVGTSLQWKSPKAFFVHLGLGLRFSHCPAYETYSQIFTVWEVPLNVGIGFKFGNRKG